MKDEVDSSQLPVLTHEYFELQHLVETRNVDGAKLTSNVSFIFKNI